MIELRNVTKYFPGVCALNDVSCTFNDGEIHALLGENGAGKSTLVKAICGMHKQNAGVILVDKQESNFRSYVDALASGVCIVNQEIQVVSMASVAENIMLDRLNMYRTPLGLNWQRLYNDTAEILKLVKLDISPKKIIGTLSAAHKQLIQIAKALVSKAKHILLDEPTSSLTQYEVETLFTILRELKSQQICIIFISHKLEEVLSICDKVTILRDGEHIKTCSTFGLSTPQIVEMMIGRKTKEEYMGVLNIDEKSPPALEVRHASAAGYFKDMSFYVRKGEILGFYGLVGSGRTELAKAIIGAYKMDSGEILRDGKKIKINSVADAIYKYGIGYVSENRKEEGLFLNFDVKDNLGITVLHQFKIDKFHILNLKKMENNALNIVKDLAIRTTGLSQIVHTLSGGNQQKVSIGKWLARNCDILIIDEPSVGVDVGAKDAIHDLIWNLAQKENKSVVLISSDMPELIKLSRRILVFRQHMIVAEIKDINDEQNFSYEKISNQIGTVLA